MKETGTNLDELAVFHRFLSDMQHRTEKIPPREFWKDEWGTSYSDRVKANSLSPALQRWETEGKLGPVILDLGSGGKPTTRQLREHHQFIDIDFGARDENTYQDRLRLALDINEIPTMSFATRRAIVNIARFLKLDLEEPPSPKQIDTVICSEIINYINYQAVLRTIKQYMKPGARLCILNQPDRCPPAMQKLLHDNRPFVNCEILEFLEAEGFEIEEVRYPYNDILDDEDFHKYKEHPERDMILILARLKQTNDQCPEKSPSR